MDGLFLSGSLAGFSARQNIRTGQAPQSGRVPQTSAPKIHQSRVVKAGVPVWQQFAGALPQRFAPAAGIDRNLEIEEASEQTRDVRFDDRNRLIEGKRGHGVRGVTANSRQSPNRIQ